MKLTHLGLLRKYLVGIIHWLLQFRYHRPGSSSEKPVEDSQQTYVTASGSFSFHPHFFHQNELQWLRYQGSLTTSVQTLKNHETHVHKDVTILGSTGSVVTRDGKILLTNAYSRPRYFKRSSDLREVLLNRFLPCDVEFDWAISLVTALSENYYHWTMDILPRMFNYHRICDQFQTEICVLIPGNAKPFMLESLKAIGVPPARIKTWTYRKARVRNLLVPDFWGNWHETEHGIPTVYPAENFTSLEPYRRRMLSARTLGCTPRVIVEREDPSLRGFSNRAEARQFFQKLGFVAFQLEELQLADQAALFRGADVVVLTHGAAFTNLIFARPGTLVLEFFPRPIGTHKINFFFQIARYYGLDYHVFCLDSDEKGNIPLDMETKRIVKNLLIAHRQK